jgi:hypothetical protein
LSDVRHAAEIEELHAKLAQVGTTSTLGVAHLENEL